MRRSPFEFVAMLAMLMATIAFSIDAMLPALPQIAQALSPDAVNRAQLVLTAFVLGNGLGTLFSGPLADAFGRRPAIFWGLALYAAASLVAWRAQSLEVMLVARFVQGLGASGPRIASMALVRDLYEGREMARIMSFISMLFILIPAVAPSIGALIIAGFGWRAVFLAFVVFAAVNVSWIALRQPETLPEASRRPLRAAVLWDGVTQVLSDWRVRLYTVAMGFGFGQMFGILSSTQQVYESYGVTGRFPLWFAATALVAGLGSVVNARLVRRLGMWRMATFAFGAQALVSLVLLAVTLVVPMPLWLWFLWSSSVFFMAGVTFGNINALAMQKMGHIAGMVASVTGALSTVIAVVIAAPLGLMFDGTARPVLLGVIACSALAFWMMRATRGADEGAAA